MRVITTKPSTPSPSVSEPSKPVQSKPAQTEPAQTEPAQTESEPTKLEPTKSEPTKSAATVATSTAPLDDNEFLDLPVCETCGTQFSSGFAPALEDPLGCRICADPRQYVPPGGLHLTTLRSLQSSETYKNTITPVSSPTQEVIWQIVTVPKFAIGQRAFFIKTSRGNILWDLVAYLDSDTEEWIKSQGGLHAIVISHPHYYTTHATWAKTFGCQVWIAPEDREWLSFPTSSSSGKTEKDVENTDSGIYRWLTDTKTEVIDGGSGFTALKVGGHFPGSLCAIHKDRLFIADTLITVPSAHNPPGVNEMGYTGGRVAYAFMWSIPNMIPLSASEIENIVEVLDTVEFSSTHGAFEGMDVTGGNVKQRLKESAEVAIGSMKGQRVLG